MLRLLIVSVLVGTGFASFCGQSAVPFTFQVLRSGHPVLGCARPKCFGWTANGTRAGDSAQFYRIAGKEDGYLRKSDQTNIVPSTIPNYVPQVSACEESFKSNSCGQNQWVAGLVPQSDPFSSRIEMRCCNYTVLQYSQDRGIASVKQGQLVVGGEVIEDGKLVAFDYVSNLSKEVHSNGTIIYYASIKRMPCYEDKQVEVRAPQHVDSTAGTVVERPVQPVQPVQVPQPSSPIQIQQLPQVAVANGIPQIQQPQLPTPQYLPQQQFAQVPNYAVQTQYGNGALNNGQTPFGQFSQQGYGLVQAPQYGQPAQYGQFAQPAQPQFPTPMQDPFAALVQQRTQELHQSFLQQQQQMMSANLPQYQVQAPAMQGVPVAPIGLGQAPIGLGQAPAPISTSTLPPVTLPKLEDLPKLQIPSVEDVEQVIPPVQRAILTSVAKFFGVL